MSQIKRVALLHISQSQESLNSPIDRRSDYYRQRAFEEGKPSRSAVPQALLTAPNILTLLRILLVPVLAVFWFSNHRLAPLCSAATFLVASFTDWADGFLARKMKLVSEFGSFLDPVADKIMVSTALVLLAATPPEPLEAQQIAIPVSLIIGREITMSALREWASASGGGAHKAVKVSSLGKWKTCFQMVALSCLLLLRRADQLPFLGGSPEAMEWAAFGLKASLALLWGGTILGLWSLLNYLSSVWEFFRFPAGDSSAPQLPSCPSPFSQQLMQAKQQLN